MFLFVGLSIGGYLTQKGGGGKKIEEEEKKMPKNSFPHFLLPHTKKPWHPYLSIFYKTNRHS